MPVESKFYLSICDNETGSRAFIRHVILNSDSEEIIQLVVIEFSKFQIWSVQRDHMQFSP